MCNQKTSKDIHKSTCSQGSEDGVMRCDSQDGQTIGKSGRDHAHANRLVSPVREVESTTADTFGHICKGLSKSADLQRSLENRLRANLDVSGSMEFALKWKHWDMESGQPICALRASAHRILDKDSGSWPTPNAGPQNDTDTKWQERRAKIKAKKKNGNGFGMTLGMAASLANWPTPTCGDDNKSRTQNPQEYSKKDMSMPNCGSNLANTAQAMVIGTWGTPKVAMGGYQMSNGKKILNMAGQAKLAVSVIPWPTPTKASAKQGMTKPDGKRGQTLVGAARNQQWTTSGSHLNSSTAQTEKPGALNPAHSRWLMGYPPEWDDCGVTAMLSSRKSPKRL